jgi:membrane protease subunit HflC
MLKIIAVLLVVLSVIAGIVGPQAFFVVDEKQLAIVTRFGEIKQTIKHPGLYMKTPFVDSITYYDKRLLIFDAPPDSLLTKDKKRLIIDVYARARIVDPELFRRTVQTESQGRSRALTNISSELRTEIASDNQSEIITTKREDIMARVRANVEPKLALFGLEIQDVRIKRADFPPEIAESVYARMQAERKRKADRERAQGAEIDAQVRATVDKEATIIKATAQRQADITRGEGEARAVEIFAEAISADPAFYSFQRSLQAYKKILKSNATVVLPADSDLFEFLQSYDGLKGAFGGE